MMREHFELKDVSSSIWLKKIPVSWDFSRLKYLFSERVEKGHPNEQLLVASQNMGVVSKKVYGNRTVEALKDLHLLKFVKVGDFVISLRSFQGGIEYTYHQGIISPAYTILYPNDPQYAGYFKYLAKSKLFISMLQLCVTGIREGQNIDYNKLRNFKIPVPPRDEQDQIVRFLDWKVSKINALIGGYKKQICLLKERRASVIELAVTQGIDNSVELKNSEIHWLPKIPKHWNLARIKSFVQMKSGDNITSVDIRETGKYPVYGGNGLRGYYSKFNMHGKYILIGRQGALAGNVHKVDGCFWATDHALIVSFVNNIDFEYFYYLLIGMNLNQYAFNTAAQPGLAASKILNLGIPIPPINEQKAIADFLTYSNKKTDHLINITNQKIKTLEELKATLISDAVTGQIDVRDIEIPEYERIEEDLDEDAVAESETEEIEEQED